MNSNSKDSLKDWNFKPMVNPIRSTKILERDCYEAIVEPAKALDTQVGGDHYKGMVIQPVEYILKNGLGYCEGNVIKYVSRHESKNGKEDLEKAIHYLRLIIEEKYGC